MSDEVELDIKGYAEVRDSHPQPTASVDAKPVAYLKEWMSDGRTLRVRVDLKPDLEAWLNRLQPTVTPLYTEAQMQARADAARREALEEAAKVADGYAAAGKDNPQLAPISAQMRYCAQRIRALKENPNAG